MKRILIFFTILVFSCLSVHAELKFDPNIRYKLVCQSDKLGCLALGSYHGSSALLYHFSGNTPEDGWWYIREGKKGFTICNAANSEYIIHDTQRIDNIKKGLALSQTLEGDATEWYIESLGQKFVFKSVEDPTQWFNLRYGDSHLMGTYPGSGSINELFDIYDELGRKVKPESGNFIPPVEGDFAQSMQTLQFNHKQLAYDNDHFCYYFSLPDSVREGKPFNFCLDYSLKSGSSDLKVMLDDSFIQNENGLYTLDAPDCDSRYSLYLVDAEGDRISQADLQFTYLPIVEINLGYCNSEFYNGGTIRVTDGNNAGHDSLYHATFRHRGGMSLIYEKKSFNIKLKDANGKPMDRRFFGLRKDNRWILDAMMIDKSCMRNRVAMDLWNDFATPPYYADLEPKARTGTRGKFVEVFWNNSYHGLFCMSERIDRKQLDIKKFVPAAQSTQGKNEVHGVLYKAKQWGYEVFMGHDMDSEILPGRLPADYNNTLGQESWCNYEIKYPDYETEAVEWKPLYDAVKFAATSTHSVFDRDLHKYFDIPVLIDYYLFLDLLLASDNHGKNMYYLAYDQASPEGRKLSIAPWDLDAILGINWQSKTELTTPDWDWDSYIRKHEHGNNVLYIKLRDSQSINWEQLLAFRYAKLRTDWFYPESLIGRITRYAELFSASCADIREESKWGGWHSDIYGGAEYIKSWIEARIETLDKKYGFDPVTSSINDAAAEQYLKIHGLHHSISVSCGCPQLLSVYTLSGQLVRQVQLNEGENIIRDIPAGIYLVGQQKVLVE